MKKIILLFIVTFIYQSISMANDISDFEIAKITIGESLLKYYTAENELRVNEIYDPQSKLTKVIILDPSLYPYEKLQVTYAGKNQVILSIEGLIDYENNFSGDTSCRCQTTPHPSTHRLLGCSVVILGRRNARVFGSKRHY